MLHTRSTIFRLSHGSFLHVPQSGLGARTKGWIDKHRDANGLGQ
jgi:hypothetical protein